MSNTYEDRNFIQVRHVLLIITTQQTEFIISPRRPWGTMQTLPEHS